jgi:probable rRNA maturation factor
MIVNRQRLARIPRRSLELFLRRLQAELILGETGVTVCFVSDAEIARMNRVFRGKRGPTDVLSFPARSRRKPRLHRGGSVSRHEDGYAGDIAISTAAAQRNAAEFGRAFPTELRILILHGVLHLVGYDHETDQGQMERAERKLRRRLGLN